jgi:DNA-directed RNA polymerase subunit RPC12/RpoP
MAGARTIVCPSCGFRNTLPLTNERCVSCGAKIEDLKRSAAQKEEAEHHYQQEGFSIVWFAVSVGIMAILTTAVVIGLPLVIPLLDFEGSAGMMISIPVWFAGGVLVGLVSPGRTFIEPVVATFLVALPTAFLLFQSQTVKTLPLFMYLLLGAVGVLFTLVGSYLGERIQLGSPPKSFE